MLCDLDRRDPVDKLKATWIEFRRFTKGSDLLRKFEKDSGFWRGVEEAVGIVEFKTVETPAMQRTLTAEEFFIQVACSITRSVVDCPERKLLLFGVWYLQVEARLARPFRHQDRIELVYRYLHPRLKAKGLLAEFEGDKDLEKVVRYFVKGSIY
ncbi:hypothetical protein ACNQKQ_11075 [Bdellovibrio bacteriovorus]